MTPADRPTTMTDDLRAGIEARRLVAEVQTGMRGYSEGDLRAVARYLADAVMALLAAHPVQDEVTFETNLLDPVWLTTSSSRCTTRPAVPAGATITRRDRRNATDAVNDALDAAGHPLTEHDLTLVLTTFLAALGIVVSDRPEVTP